MTAKERYDLKQVKILVLFFSKKKKTDCFKNIFADFRTQTTYPNLRHTE